MQIRTNMDKYESAMKLFKIVVQNVDQ